MKKVLSQFEVTVHSKQGRFKIPETVCRDLGLADGQIVEAELEAGNILVVEKFRLTSGHEVNLAHTAKGHKLCTPNRQVTIRILG